MAITNVSRKMLNKVAGRLYDFACRQCTTRLPWERVFVMPFSCNKSLTNNKLKDEILGLEERLRTPFQSENS